MGFNRYFKIVRTQRNGNPQITQSLFFKKGKDKENGFYGNYPEAESNRYLKVARTQRNGNS